MYFLHLSDCELPLCVRHRSRSPGGHLAARRVGWPARRSPADGELAKQKLAANEPPLAIITHRLRVSVGLSFGVCNGMAGWLYSPAGKTASSWPESFCFVENWRLHGAARARVAAARAPKFHLLLCFFPCIHSQSSDRDAIKANNSNDDLPHSNARQNKTKLH